MSLTGLPLDLFSLIVDFVVAQSPISGSLPLRQVSKVFQYAVNGAFFERQVRNGSYAYADNQAGERMPRSDMFRYVHGHIHPYQRKHPFAVELGAAATLLLEHDELLQPLLAGYSPESSTNIRRNSKEPHCLGQMRHLVTSIISYAVMDYLKLEMCNILYVFGYQNVWVPRYGSWSWAMITAVYVGDLTAVDAVLEMTQQTPERECVLFHCLRAGALMGNGAITKLALVGGASIHQPSSILRRSLSGCTILEDACKAAHYEVISMLLECGIQRDTDTSVYNKAITCAAYTYRSEDGAKLAERTRIIDLVLSKAAPSLHSSLKSDAMSTAIGCESLPLVRHILGLELTLYEYVYPHGSRTFAGWVNAAMFSSNGDIIRTTLGEVIGRRGSEIERAVVEDIVQRLADLGAVEKLLCIWEGVLQENVQDIQLMDLMFRHARRDLQLDVLLTMYARGYLPDWDLYVLARKKTHGYAGFQLENPVIELVSSKGYRGAPKLPGPPSPEISHRRRGLRSFSGCISRRVGRNIEPRPLSGSVQAR